MRELPAFKLDFPMKALSPFFCTLLVGSLLASASSPKAQRDEALQEAAKEKKDLIMIFSGASWNQASQDFEKNILKAPEFQKAVDPHFKQAFFEIPPTRDGAHEDLLAFEKTYRFSRIPTLILTDSSGRPYAYLETQEKETAAFLKQLEESRQIRVKRDQAFEAALKEEGKKRAETFVKALKTLPQRIILEFYEKELKMIEEADPKGETKYAGEVRKARAIEEERARYNELFSKRQYDQIIKQAKTEGKDLTGEDAQRLKLYEVQALFSQKKYDAALKEVTLLKEMAPESDLGKRADQFSKQIEAAKMRQKRREEAAKKPKKPVVSKPVAIVTDVEVLRQDVKKAADELAQAEAKEKEAIQAREDLAAKMASLEAELEALREQEKASAEAVKKATETKEKMARKATAMKEVLENHLAMEKRKREVSELEKKAAELQKQAEELREKAEEVRKGK